MDNGKRGAQQVVEEQVMDSKLQKMINGGVELAVELEIKTQENNKKEQTSSSEEHLSSQSEEEQNKVDSAPAVVVPPTKPMDNGKRGAPQVVDEQVMDSKKQKIINGGIEQAVEFETKNQENTKKEQTSSLEEHLSSLSEEEQNKEIAKLDSQTKKFPFGAVESGSAMAPLKEEESDNPEDASSKERGSNEEEVGSAPAVVVPPTKPMDNGKRGAPQVVEEQVMDSKKQKIINGCIEQAVEFETKNQENTKKEQTSSLEEHLSSQSEDKQNKEIPKVASQPKKFPFGAVKSGSAMAPLIEEESDNPKEATSKETGSNEEEVEVAPVKNSEAATQDAKGASTSNEKSEEEGEDDSSNKEDDQHLGTPKKSDTDVDIFDASSLKKTPQTPITSQATGSKTLFMRNLSFSIEEEDVKNFFKDAGEIAEIRFAMREDRFLGYGQIEFTAVEAAQEALRLNNEILLDRPVRLDLVRERGGDPTTTPQAIGSKILFMGNLSYAIKEDDVKNFFKDVAEVAEIRFVVRDDRFLGFGHVEFNSVEAAQEALKLNNELLLDRRVKLDLAKERAVYTPGSCEKSNQKGQQPQGKTIYVRGFGTSGGFDNIRRALEKHFGNCGEISRMSIPKDYESGAPKGVSFIDFADSNGFNQALELNGSQLGGYIITVEEAKKQRCDSREGFGHGGGRGFGGRSGGSGRFGGTHGGRFNGSQWQRSRT